MTDDAGGVIYMHFPGISTPPPEIKHSPPCQRRPLSPCEPWLGRGEGPSRFGMRGEWREDLRLLSLEGFGQPVGRRHEA